MLENLTTSVKGRLRAARSRWQPDPVRVAELTRHRTTERSPFADWLQHISARGFRYQSCWSLVEYRREQLIASLGQSVDKNLSAEFFGPHAKLEYIHVNARGGRFLSSVVQRFTNPTVVEYGTAFGVSGMYILSTIGEGHMVTFDPCQDWRDLAIANLLSISTNFVRIPDTFESGFPSLARSVAPIHVAFIDGLHTYENVMREVTMLEPFMPTGGVFVLHDVDLDDEMREAWKDVKRHPRARCSAFVERQFGVLELGS